jgi:pimeloyl-ACP methyl ester carboxylesterase
VAERQSGKVRPQRTHKAVRQFVEPLRRLLKRFSRTLRDRTKPLRHFATLPLCHSSVLLLMGCSQPHNPHFTITPETYETEVAHLESSPRPLPRPLIILDAWHHPPASAGGLRRRLLRLTGADDDATLAISFTVLFSIDAAARRTVNRIEERWPSDNPHETSEVDIVGYSMGGIVARYAADLWDDLPPDSRPAKRLNIRNLYTIASPHRGARLARWIFPDRAAWSMRPGSNLLARLDAARAERERYNLICYTQLHDITVGATNTAPPGELPLWLPATGLFSHQTVRTNRHILLDIALRLRGEEPIATPGDPPPCN